MCEFKSAIYLESGKVLDLPNDDSHKNILEAHGIPDKGIPADFVKIECVPQENPKDIFNWKFIVDMSDDELPDWWNDGHAKTAEKAMRKLIVEKYLHIGETIETVDYNGYFYDCKIGSISGGVQNLWGNSTISTVSGGRQDLWGNSTIGTVSGGRQHLHDNSTISTVSGGVQNLWGNSTISTVSGGVQNLWGNSTISTVSGGVQNRWGNSKVINK